ncbi:DUF4276 family protein [Desulfovibrio sulfodismutans]|uniref:DUF4276 family protein n=1 Tax=Desulfolutivibrio sulfodismutans TaxID=63561 RepID=A0A7K3NHP3_9BACT|nr:DUF4276 family protein [Desulfolutivibrio sulfodismutans]NDY55724.1 DUF4276 family protein [Desulfolutivibrio sulfodismutans]
MKIVVLVEGDTEVKALPPFFRRWLAAGGCGHVGVVASSFRGNDNYLKEYAKKARLFLAVKDVIGVIGLLDLYGLKHPQALTGTMAQRYKNMQGELEKNVAGVFRQHFAVHELEAWLLSDPDLFDSPLRPKLPKKSPEKVNFDMLPAKVLEKHYPTVLGRDYKKTTDGVTLFQKLDPAVAAAKCPYLKALLEDLLDMARKSAKAFGPAEPSPTGSRHAPRTAKHPRGGAQG